MGNAVTVCETMCCTTDSNNQTKEDPNIQNFKKDEAVGKYSRPMNNMVSF